MDSFSISLGEAHAECSNSMAPDHSASVFAVHIACIEPQKPWLAAHTVRTDKWWASRLRIRLAAPNLLRLWRKMILASEAFNQGDRSWDFFARR